MDAIINNYIEQHYQNWLDYTFFHCSQNEMQDETYDLLNEVILALLSKDPVKLKNMVEVPSKCGRYKLIDIYVLRMIKLNVYSKTSPYQSKFKKGKLVDDVDFSRLKIIDEPDDQDDKPERIFSQTSQVRSIVGNLNLSTEAMAIFEHRFIHNLPFSEWPGPEPKKELYETYNKVVQLIKAKLKGESLL